MSVMYEPKEAQARNCVAAIPLQVASYRLEIDEFLADNAMTNLFILALEEIQRKPIEAFGKEDWWTFYNLAGMFDVNLTSANVSIHSEPNEMWDGVPSEGEDGPGIYCTHGSTVFPTWHRAYVMMYEQALTNKVRVIANRYTDVKEKRTYKNAALRFRLPYWDPYLPRNHVERQDPVPEKIWGLPQILAAKMVYVQRPRDKKLDYIENPLYIYNMPAEEIVKSKGRTVVNWARDGFGNLSPNWETTIDGPKGGATLNQNIQRQAKPESAKVWQMLNPDEFANHYIVPGQRERWESNVSLESWHDDIHILVGSGDKYAGNMAKVPVAGFDPIFWLHHNNIDWLFALYQSIYPDKFVSKEPSRIDGMHLTSPLYPFRKSKEDFYNSADLQNWKNLGFAMPGSRDLNEEGKEIVKQYLRDTYYWATEGSYPPESLKFPKDLSKVVALHGEDAKADHSPAVHLEALQQTKSNTFQLVTQSLAMDTSVPATAEANLANEITDTTFKDETSNEALYPKGSFTVGTDPSTKQMRTWNAHIRVKKYAFNDSFSIHLFIGQVNDSQPQRFMTKKNEVGFTGVFASDGDSGCANCSRQRELNVIYTDVIPITPALTNYLENAVADSTGTLPEADMRMLKDVEPENVKPFLKKHLDWRMVDVAAGQKNDQDMIDSMLEIAVTDRLFDVPTEENPLGTYHESTVHPEITQGRVGGYNGE